MDRRLADDGARPVGVRHPQVSSLAEPRFDQPPEGREIAAEQYSGAAASGQAHILTIGLVRRTERLEVAKLLHHLRPEERANEAMSPTV